MSNPYGPEIETMEEWNDALGCCCQMPQAPEPVTQVETLTVDACGYLAGQDTSFNTWINYSHATTGQPAEEFRIYYTTVTITKSTSESETVPVEEGADGYTKTDQAQYITIYKKTPNEEGVCEVEDPAGSATWSGSFTPSYETELEGDYFTGSSYSGSGNISAAHPTGIGTTTSTTNYSESSPTVIVSGTSDLPFRNPTAGSWSGSSFTIPGENGSVVIRYSEPFAFTFPAWPESPASPAYGLPSASRTVSRAIKKRYRWLVPVTHLGSYYKITWDVLYEPTGWDDESVAEADRPIRFSRKDNTVEWEGPGTGPQTDPSWQAGDWYELEAPEEIGERRIINIRYEHLRREGA